MQSISCYCAVEGALGVIRNAENTVAARPSELVMGVPCELKFRLFEGFTTPPVQYPPERFSGVSGWSFEMDSDFSSLSTVKLVADNADIALAEVTEGGKTYTEITIPIRETYTAELAVAMDGRECLTLAGELVAYDADHEPLRIVQIKGLVVRGRVAGLGEPTPIPTAAYEELASRTVAEAMSSGGYITSSGAAVIASDVVMPVSGGLQSQINALSSGGGMPSGAIIENQPFSTTVGDYNITFSDGGLEITNVNGGLTILASSGYIQAGVWDELSEESTDLLVTNGGITANGSAITQAESIVEDTSLVIDTLEGGVKYVCQSALTALSIGSAAPGCNGTILFTAGATVTPTLPVNVPHFGVTECASGSRYAVVINGDMAVVVEAAGV